MKIGVFDSGVGGLSVKHAIQKALPQAEVVLKDDIEHVPYGTRKPEEIFEFVLPILQSMVNEKCEVIVIACNTVTTTLISELRAALPIPLIGMEPMIKPAAAQTKTKVIAVCATPATLQSKRYQWLKQTFAQDITVLEPDCSDWALMIEQNQIDHEKIKQRIDDACQAGADIIVLGCTHYHWIEAEVRSVAASRAVVLQPEVPVIEQLQRVLQR